MNTQAQRLRARGCRCTGHEAAGARGMWLQVHRACGCRCTASRGQRQVRHRASGFRTHDLNHCPKGSLLGGWVLNRKLRLIKPELQGTYRNVPCAFWVCTLHSHEDFLVSGAGLVVPSGRRSELLALGIMTIVITIIYIQIICRLKMPPS